MLDMVNNLYFLKMQLESFQKWHFSNLLRVLAKSAFSGKHQVVMGLGFCILVEGHQQLKQRFQVSFSQPSSCLEELKAYVTDYN